MPAGALAAAARLRHQTDINRSYAKTWLRLSQDMANNAKIEKTYFVVMVVRDIGEFYMRHYAGKILYANTNFEKAFQEFIWYWLHNCSSYREYRVNGEQQYLLVESNLNPEILTPQLVIDSNLPFLRFYIYNGKIWSENRGSNLLKKVKEPNIQAKQMFNQMVTICNQVHQLSKKELLRLNDKNTWWKKLFQFRESLEDKLLYHKFYKTYLEIYRDPVKREIPVINPYSGDTETESEGYY